MAAPSEVVTTGGRSLTAAAAEIWSRMVRPATVATVSAGPPVPVPNEKCRRLPGSTAPPPVVGGLLKEAMGRGPHGVAPRRAGRKGEKPQGGAKTTHPARPPP